MYVRIAKQYYTDQQESHQQVRECEEGRLHILWQDHPISCSDHCPDCQEEELPQCSGDHEDELDAVEEHGECRAGYTERATLHEKPKGSIDLAWLLLEYG